MPGYKKHYRLHMSSILHPPDFAAFLLLQRIGSCLAKARQQIRYHIPVDCNHNLINHIYNKILDRDWFSVHLFVT